jgi:hypothetical protein
VLVIAWGDRQTLTGKMTTPEERKVMVQLKLGLPVRWSAVHICVPDGPFSKLYRAFILLAFGQESRVRARVYPGFNLETRYKLLTFGINVVDFPLTHTGSIKVKNHLQWIATRRAIDEARNNGVVFQGISHPGVNDVLFSKGGNQNHHGNYEFKSVIEFLLSQDRYKNLFLNYHSRRILDHDDREAIRHEVIYEVQSRGGRFLALDKGGWWVELPIDSVSLHNKIAISVYDHQKRLEARQKERRTRSDTSDFLNDQSKSPKLSKCNFCRNDT